MKNKSSIIFKNENHKIQYFEILSKMNCTDSYHRSAAYLITLAELVPNDVFNFKDDHIILDGLNKSWQTSSTQRTTRLMYNLWNGWAYENKNAKANSIASPLYSVESIFCDYEYAPYFCEAIRIRFDWD